VDKSTVRPADASEPAQDLFVTANSGRTTRLAPSPTGALHLGNARTFLANWALARRHGWRILLRVEDLDGPRIKPGAAAATIDTLRWLGLDWDAGPFVQSEDLAPYRAAMNQLAEHARVYPSGFSRSEIEEAAASAPQEGVHEVAFPASLRPALVPCRFDDEHTNWRFATPEGLVRFDDAFAGPQTQEPARTIGDFVVWTRRGVPAYQLAVVVDDARQGVTDVVRGDDLLDSAGRQILLYRALGLAPEPTYTHLPLVRGPDGRRLAKRHGDTRLETYRAAGVSRDRIVGLLASWSGITPREEPREMAPTEFMERLDLTRMSPDAVVFTAKDEAWLRRR
jgi:glutamyl-tRNA synthetase